MGGDPTLFLAASSSRANENGASGEAGKERGSEEGGGELFIRPRANFFLCSLLLLRPHLQTAVEEGAASKPG